MSISLTALFLIGLTLALWIYTFIFLRSVVMERNLLRKLAYQDPVTGLFNRNALELYWKQRNSKESTAIMYLDLDGFKAINDTYGHQIGDKLLRRVSDHLLQVTNSNQKAFRIGGDEFLLIMKDYDADQVKVLAELLLQKISAPYNIQGILRQVFKKKQRSKVYSKWQLSNTKKDTRNIKSGGQVLFIQDYTRRKKYPYSTLLFAISLKSSKWNPGATTQVTSTGSSPSGRAVCHTVPGTRACGC